MKFKVDDEVIFATYDDLVWGEYAGQKAIVVETFDEDEDGGLQALDIVFDDGRKLGVQSYECFMSVTL